MTHHSNAWRPCLLARLAMGCVLFLAGAEGRTETAYRFERLWPTLQQPWYFFRPAGIAVDHDGNLYVADTSNNRIRKSTSDGQYITQWGRDGNGPGEMSWPTGLSIAPNGLLYVADRLNDSIQVFNRDGTRTGGWSTHRLPTGVATDQDGDVYVTYGDNLRVQKYTAEGALVDEFIGDGSTSLPENSRCAPDALIPCEWTPGIAVDRQGRVFVSDSVNLRIIRLNADLDFEFAFGEDGQEMGSAGTLFGPSFGIAVDGEGNLYVNDVFNGRVQKFSADGDFLGVIWGRPGDKPGEMAAAAGITVDAVGNVFVADTTNDRIQKFTATGRFLNQWGSLSQRPGAFDRPGDVAVDAAGNVYVADKLNHRIEKFGADGAFILTWGQEGRGHPDSFVLPHGVAIGSDGNVYVADTFGGDENGVARIAVFSSEGAFLRDWPIPHTSGAPGIPDESVFPNGIAVDRAGNVYVCESSYVQVVDPSPGENNDPVRHRVQKFSPQGELLREWGRFGVGDGEFLSPVAISVDAEGNVYVAEEGAFDCTGVEGECPPPGVPPRVQKFTSDGAFLLKWGGFQPSGIAVDGDGNVLVSDASNNRIRKFSPIGQFIQTWGELGDSPGQFLFPGGLDVAPDDSVYVTDIRHSRVQQFRPVELAMQNKAIIVAGATGGPGDTLRPATEMCANVAYRALAHQGFGKDTIRYLSFDADFDLDSNGIEDDILPATNAELEASIVTWAADAKNVILYLTGPGGQDRFQINETEFVQALTLDTWLDTLQEHIPGALVVICDFSAAGSFLDNLSAPKSARRIVVASTSPGETAYFVTGGTLSFSNHFWLGVFNGLSVSAAFTAVRNSVGELTGYEHPLLDGNGNGIGNEAEDFAEAAGVTLFNGALTFDERPSIQAVSLPQDLAEDVTSATFFAQSVADDQNVISRVWAVITPPGGAKATGDSVLILPTFDLVSDAGGDYGGAFDTFVQDGEYVIDIYALDGNLNIAQVQRTTVTKNVLFPGSLICTVWDAVSLLSISNAAVSLDPLGLTIMRNTDGVYVFAGIPSGRYDVFVHAPAYRDASQSVSVSSGEVVLLNFPLLQIIAANADIDNDGSVNAVDVQLVINAALDLPTGYNGDINHDGAADALDVQMVINVALGIG